ncbi:MAG: nitrous oxide reductase accessory protein NosL, partial [Flavisolibacter sp.]
MNIWLNKITGQVDIINGLNHYIGMKHIKADMFPEFGYLIYIVGFFILFGLIIAITGKRKLLFSYLIFTILGGIAAMYDFYSWGYDYGHNLDPKAAIQIPGLTYQPPLIGHKTLLNFDAYSYPDIGGWVIIVVSFLLFLVCGYELIKNHERKRNIMPENKKLILAIATLILFFISSCNLKPQPFAYGKDSCDDCRMTIMDPKFGGEIITRKGRIFKFDDAHCLANFIKKGTVKQTDIRQIVFINYDDNRFIGAKSLFFVVSPQLKSPMNSNAAAFLNNALAKQKAKITGGTVKNWNQLYQSL